MVEFDAIILAAGLSRRMGAQNKLLLDWGGMPIIRRVVMTYIDAIGPNVTVVTGYQADRVQDVLQDLPVSFCFNPAFETGQQSSVTAGLREAHEAKFTLIGLGDQPLLTVNDLHQLTAAHRLSDEEKITIPVTKSARGNPLVVPAALRARLLADQTQPGCKKFTAAHPDLVQKLPLNAAGLFTDVDTPQAYVALKEGLHDVHR